jgi:hypothetical protein
MKNQLSPPVETMALPVPLASAKLSKVQWTVLGLVEALGHVVDRQRHGRIRHVQHHVDAVAFEPFARLGGAHVGLVLMVGEDDLDLQFRVRIGLHVVFEGHSGARYRALARRVCIEAGLVVQNADLDGTVEGGLGNGRDCRHSQ